MEWRRADPADNTATRGGVSSKRENATFVGRVAADALPELSYRAVEFALDPPKRGGERPPEWHAVADTTADTTADWIAAALSD